jgi:transposase
MSRLPEVIATVQRRRRWSTEEKVAILDAAFRRGGSVAAAADRFEVSRALIYLWRSQVRSGAMPGVTLNEGGAAAFAPVTLIADAAPPAALPAERKIEQRRRTGTVEVRLVNGRTVTAEESIAPDVLAAIVTALDVAAS